MSIQNIFMSSFNSIILEYFTLLYARTRMRKGSQFLIFIIFSTFKNNLSVLKNNLGIFGFPFFKFCLISLIIFVWSIQCQISKYIFYLSRSKYSSSSRYESYTWLNSKLDFILSFIFLHWVEKNVISIRKIIWHEQTSNKIYCMFAIQRDSLRHEWVLSKYLDFALTWNKKLRFKNIRENFSFIEEAKHAKELALFCLIYMILSRLNYENREVHVSEIHRISSVFSITMCMKHYVWKTILRLQHIVPWENEKCEVRILWHP